MPKTDLTPEKITHPLQLMAAWFVMLLSLVASLLTAAFKIQRPWWAAGFLVISAVVLALLVMSAVFVMLTRFRPHLQGPKEYADWIKDERRFRGETIKEVQVRELRINDAMQQPSAAEKSPSEIQTKAEIKSYLIQISDIEGSDDLLMKLREGGFHAKKYQSSHGRLNAAEQKAIWVGARIPPLIAIPAIKLAAKEWPHLTYLHLSTDGDSQPPDEIHDQLFFGGSTETAENYGLQQWTLDEIMELPDQVSRHGFHRLIRSKYN